MNTSVPIGGVPRKSSDSHGSRPVRRVIRHSGIMTISDDTAAIHSSSSIRFPAAP
jgi:hypothetical protein